VSASREAEGLDLLPEGIPVDPQDRGSLDLVAARRLERLGDEWALDLG
jgi:hypothetical protein